LYSRKQKDRQQSTSKIVRFWFLSVKAPLCGVSVISREQKLLDKNELSLLPVPRVLWSSWCCLSPLPRSSEIRDAVVLTESLSERDFAAWKKVRQELRCGRCN
jgi:hypothetical protein